MSHLMCFVKRVILQGMPYSQVSRECLQLVMHTLISTVQVKLLGLPACADFLCWTSERA